MTNWMGLVSWNGKITCVLHSIRLFSSSFFSFLWGIFQLNNFTRVWKSIKTNCQTFIIQNYYFGTHLLYFFQPLFFTCHFWWLLQLFKFKMLWNIEFFKFETNLFQHLIRWRSLKDCISYLVNKDIRNGLWNCDLHHTPSFSNVSRIVPDSHPNHPFHWLKWLSSPYFKEEEEELKRLALGVTLSLLSPQFSIFSPFTFLVLLKLGS